MGEQYKIMIKDKIKELKSKGYIQKEIVKILGCSKGMVSQYFSEDGMQKASERKKKYARDAKEHAIKYLGGECIKCGYNKCNAALDFHHRNEEDKSFIISNFKSTNYEKLEKELDKCDLVCANCHRELHFNK